MNDPIWQCADGRQLHVGEMTDSHLQNCINKILRSRKGWRRHWLDRLLLEQQIRAMGLSSRRVPGA